MQLLATTSNAISTSYTSSISLYESWSLFFSGLAVFISIAIPLGQLIVEKCKQLKINIIPFEQTALTLLFNESGSYIKLLFCIECRNQDTTIRKVFVDVIRNEDNRSYTFEWSTLESIYVNWLGVNSLNRINSVSFARPFKIRANTLEPFIIEFSANGVEGLKEFLIERDKQLQSFIKFSDKNFQNLDDARNRFKANSQKYANMLSKLDEYFLWKAGTYTVTINILHDLGMIATETFTFTLNTDESDSLKRNFESVIFGRLYENTQMPMQFSVINKSLS